MHTVLPLSLMAIVSGALFVIGCFYIAAPERILGSFGLKPPAADANTLAWLHLKGIRDVVCAMAVLILWLTTNKQTVGILFLVFALIPFGDMSNILVSGGRKATALGVQWRDLPGDDFRWPPGDSCLLSRRPPFLQSSKRSS